jgi:uncharacterized protein with PIN domain
MSGIYFTSCYICALVIVRRWLFTRDKARLKFLEERETELTAQLVSLTAQLASLSGIVSRTLDRCAENEAELQRVLPPLRDALVTFKKFNETY